MKSGVSKARGGRSSRAGTGRRHPGLVVAVLLLVAVGASADGGAVRASRVVGPYRVTVFTEPTPVRTGPVDVSVLVQDAHTRDLAEAIQVNVRGTPDGANTWRTAAPHTRREALYHGAVLQLDRPGRWLLDIRVAAAQGPARLTVDLNVAPALPRWMDLWPWLAWPLVPIAAMAVRVRRSVRRASRRHAVPHAPPNHGRSENARAREPEVDSGYNCRG